VVKGIGFAALLLISTPLLAQSQRSALYGDASLWAGAEASTFNPDYGCRHSNLVFECSHDLVGVAGLFDFNVTSKFGAEGEARWLNWNGQGNEKESTYMLGPRYRIYRFSRFSVWAKVLAGGGWITTPYYPQAGSVKGSFFAFAPGGTLDYRLTGRIKLRAEYEYQYWPSFPPNGLGPDGVSVGFTYRFLGQ